MQGAHQLVKNLSFIASVNSPAHVLQYLLVFILYSSKNIVERDRSKLRNVDLYRDKLSQ